MSVQVRIATSGTVTEKHYGLLDFGYLTVTDMIEGTQVKFDSEQYHIESDAVIVTFNASAKWNENDQPCVDNLDWQDIKSKGLRYKLELYCGFADDIENIDVPKINYSKPVLEFDGGSIDMLLDNDVTDVFKYRLFDVTSTSYSILMQDGGVACVELHEDDGYVYAELYQSRLDINDLNQQNIFDTLGIGKMYRDDYYDITDINNKTILANTLSWLAVFATFQHDPNLHNDFVNAVLTDRG